MVIVLDLEEDALDHVAYKPSSLPVGGCGVDLGGDYTYHYNEDDDSDSEDYDAASISLFAVALGCYPVVEQIARHLDLNSLHDLSATCRQFRANLLQFRTQLIKQTLRCTNDDSYSSAASQRPKSFRNGYGPRYTSGHVGLCARDMVCSCRRCGMVVCRNCTIKPPPQPALRGRHRRLCKTCMKAPLRCHYDEVTTETLHDDVVPVDCFTREVFQRGPCTCPSQVFLCLSCGNALRSADTTYMRGWTWRTRYSTYLGGLGTGIGEGHEGVECGKGDQCLVAKEIEKEIDCDADELAEMKRELEKIEGQGRHRDGTSYNMQEMEGIGGVVKKKVKKRVKVGSVVKEYEDERDKGTYLRREQEGINRSWCSWCARIVPGNKDARPQADDLARVLTGGSSSSVDSHC